jgi:hypothetical protein
MPGLASSSGLAPHRRPLCRLYREAGNLGVPNAARLEEAFSLLRPCPTFRNGNPPVAALRIYQK